MTTQLTPREQALVLAHIKLLNSFGTPDYWPAKVAFNLLRANK